MINSSKYNYFYRIGIIVTFKIKSNPTLKIVDRMNLLQRIKKIYHKLIIVKKIAWFIVNFVSMMPPFKHMRNMMEKLG